MMFECNLMASSAQVSLRKLPGLFVKELCMQ